MMDPSDGGSGDGAREEKDGKWKVPCSESKDRKSDDAPCSEKKVQACFSTSPEKANHASSKGLLSVADEGDRPIYPDTFDGFEELPVPPLSEEVDSRACIQEDEQTFKLCCFDGFEELPVPPLSEEVANRACIQEDEPYFNLCGFEISEELPVIKENIPRTKSLKRNIVDEDKMMVDSPKRSKFDNVADTLDPLSHEVKAAADKGDNTRMENLNGDDQEEDSDGTEISSERTQTVVVAESPLERFMLANAFRRIAQSQYKRGATLDRRAATLDKLGAILDKREASIDKREASVDKREASVDKREASVDKRETSIESKYTKSDDENDKTAKASSIGETIEKGKGAVERADSYATLAEKISNIPSRSTEMIKSYKENKTIARDYIKKQNKIIVNKLKGYMGGMTTAGVLNYTKDAVIGGITQVLVGETVSDGGAGVTDDDVAAAGVTDDDVAAAGVTDGDVAAAGVTYDVVAAAGVTEGDGAAGVREGDGAAGVKEGDAVAGEGSLGK